MLFTADLKTFSERLVAKVETIKVEVAIKEEVEAVTMVTEVESKVSTKRVKSEPDDNEHQLLEVKEKKIRMIKRKKKV